MITLIGANGSMGRRYKAILDWMSKPTKCFDREHSIDEILGAVADSTHVIIASPTSTHIDYLRAVMPHKAAVLCEKPITKSMEDLDDICGEYYGAGRSFAMMMQYRELVKSYETGKISKYDYFRSGPDGLVWDCLQIIGLSRGPIELSDISPIWSCDINGQKLNLSDMDRAYVRFMSKWLYGSLDQTMDEVRFMHEKVHQYLGRQ